MNALKPRKGFIQDELNIERLTPVQWDGIMRAMQNYAKHYHETMQANDFEKPQKQCTIRVDSNTVGKLFCGVEGGFCQHEGRDRVCMQNDECVNQIAK